MDIAETTGGRNHGRRGQGADRQQHGQGVRRAADQPDQDGRARLVVDLKQIIYISSAGFRALLVAGKLADETKGTLALCGLSAELQRLFDLGAFTDLFTIYGSRDESIAKLT